jgi:hypothetical protein
VDRGWLLLRVWPALLELWDLAAAREAYGDWQAFVNQSLMGHGSLNQQQHGLAGSRSAGVGLLLQHVDDAVQRAIPLSYVRAAAQVGPRGVRSDRADSPLVTFCPHLLFL